MASSPAAARALHAAHTRPRPRAGICTSIALLALVCLYGLANLLLLVAACSAWRDASRSPASSKRLRTGEEPPAAVAGFNA